MSPADRERLLAEERARRGQASNNVAMSGRNPAEVARAKRLARTFGVAPQLVEDDPKPFEEQLERAKAETAIEANPWMAPPLANNIDMAAIFNGDDLAKTGDILGAFGIAKPTKRYSFDAPRISLPGKTPPPPRLPGYGVGPAMRVVKNLGAITGTAVNSIIGSVAGVAENIVDFTPLDRDLDPFFRGLQAAREESDRSLFQEIAPWVNTGTKRGVFSAAVSLTQMGATLPAGAARVLPLLTGITYGNAYQKYQGDGASVGMSMLGAGIEGGIEYATEKLPVGWLTTRLGKGSAREFLGQFVVADTLGEQIATAGQSLTEAMISPKSDQSFKDWLLDPARGQQAWETLVASTVMSGGIGAGNIALKRLGKASDTAVDTTDALIGQTLLDDAMTKAAAVEARTTSPEDFAKFVAEGAANTPVKNVYIPIEAIDAAMADETLPEEEKAALRFYQDQIDEARLNNGEVVIPIGDALASFAGTKVWQSLRDDARVLAGGISGREARENATKLVDELEAIGKQAMEDATKAEPAVAAKSAVYEDVKAQVLAAGRSNKEAQTTALLFASRAETLATERYGQFKDAAAAWKWMKLQIVGPETKVGKGKKVAQTKQPAFTDVTKLLERDDWALMTAENPDAQQLSPEENAARLAELKQVLDGMGLTYTDVRGKYDNEENSLAIEGISEEQARALGARFGQDSVLTRRGLIYRDGTVNPATGVGVLAADADNYFTELPDGTKFAIDIDFDNRVPLDDQLGWTPTRIDKLIEQYGREDGSSKAIVVMMSPDQYLGLTASERGRELIDERITGMEEYGDLDMEKLGSSPAPMLAIRRGGEPSAYQIKNGVDRLNDHVMMHEGRHRMAMLKRAGIAQVPVVVQLQDANSSTPLPSEPLTVRIAPQRSRSDQVANGDIEAFDITGIPLSEKFRDQLAALGGTTLFQSSIPPQEQASTIQSALTVARSQKFANQRDFKLAVQKQVNAYKGNKRTRRRLIRLALNDARVALENNSNAVGWYDEKVEQALAVLGTIHPEIENDPDARFAFLYALAVTSNGLKVDRNFQVADEVYREWRETGQMPYRGEGTAAIAMGKSLGMFNTLTSRFGFDGLLKLMLRRDVTVKELGEITGVTISGEHKGTTVTGAAFLGPKIGNGFFSNLYGNFDQLTMDRWFMRTWGRWTGTLVIEDKTKIKEKREVVKALIRELTPAQRAKAEKIIGYPIKLTDVDGLAKRINAVTVSAGVREALNEIHPRLRLDPKALYGLLDGQKEAPQGPRERNEIRSIMQPVLQSLRMDYPALTMADLQALLWYPEKTLYTAATSSGETSTGYEDDEAPDYANAAVALARYEGVPQKKIDEAIEAANERVADRVYAANSARRAERGIGDVPGFDPVVEDASGFPFEEGLISEGDGLTLQQFGGGNSKALTREMTTARSKAFYMLERGEDPDAVWTETGWQLGADGKWRFEISDDKAFILKLPEAQQAPDGNWFGYALDEVLVHDELFKHYPHLKDLYVVVLPIESGANGYFAGNHIALAPHLKSDKAKSVLLHEIQHAIQLHEGFVNGASTNPETLRQMGLGEELDAEIQLYRDINNGEVPGWTFASGMEEDQLLASASWNVYSRVLGEAEARNVQARAAMSPRERLRVPPAESMDVRPEELLLPQRQIYETSEPLSMSRSPRGEATFFPSGKTVIQLFGKSDFSTMLHEMSHVFLQQEFTLAKDPKASEALKADIERLTKWFLANGGDLDANGMPDRESHELFARSGERYFREGKAPSAELRGAFKQFRTWLTDIYKSIKELLVYGPAPINPEISEIFDRMIATDEAIEANATTPMSQEDLGMTTAEYDAYLDSVQGARDSAHDALLERMMKAIRRREQGRMREQRANIRAEVAEQVNSDPKWVALHLLRTGRWLNEPGREATPIKIHTGWLIDNYGEEVLGELPVGLQPLHRGDGVVGDVIADMVGMPSGDALVQALREIKVSAAALKAEGNPRPLRDQLIEDLTDAEMAERHGDIALSDEDIREEAIAALNSSQQGEILATELRQLKKTKGVGGIVTPYQLLREWARRKVNDGTVNEAVSKTALQRFIRGYNKARNAFENAILAGDNNEAIKQKQAQMINHALLAEGKVVADEINTIVRRMQRYARTKALASIDQDYMDRIHELLEGYNFRNVSDRARAEQASFEEWAAGQRALGHEVHVPDRFRDERTNWKDAKVAKLLELNDMVQSIAAQGKLKQRLVNARAERELRAVIDETESRILNLPPRTLPASSTGQEQKPFMQAAREDGYRAAVVNLLRPGSRVREAVSGLLKVEGLFDILDGTKDATGPLNQQVLRPATDAANLFSQLTEEVMEPIIARYKAMSRKQSARLRDFVTINELTLNVSIHEADTEKLGQPLTIPRMKLIGLLLNTGNLSNLSKMVGGERWGDPESAADMARVRDILVSYASKEDLDLVQDIWNGVSKLWPHIARVERELSGVVPEEVIPVGFETPHGPYTGGYWPVVWDSTRSEMGKRQGEEAETSLQGVGFGIATPKGHTITRTGAMAPMEWSVEHVLFGHMTKVISRIAYAPWVRDILKIVDNPRVTGAIRLRLGDEYVKMIKPWIRDQIPSNIADVQGAKTWERILNQVRVNMSISVLGISYSTGVAQALGLGYSAGVLGDGSIKAGGKWVAVGIAKMLQLQKDGAAGAQEFVFARSEEMKRRAHEVNQESAEVFRRLRDDDTIVRRMQAAAFWHIGFIDLNMVAIPTWMGGYHKALSEGLGEQEAIDYAEKMVRLSQSSGRQKDLSAIQRGNAGQKFISMFYTPSSVFFNQQWEAAQHLKAGNWSKALAPTFWFLVMTTIMDAMREGDWPEDDDKDGLGGMDVAEWVGRNIMFGAFYGVPIVRDITNTAERQLRGEYAEYGSTPLSYAMQTIGRGITSTKKQVDGKETEGKDLKAQVAAMGFLFGLPGNQVGKTSGFIKDVYDGKAQPDGAYDWYQGLAYGKLPAE